jgi:hypothetical protein
MVVVSVIVLWSVLNCAPNNAFIKLMFKYKAQNRSYVSRQVGDAMFCPKLDYVFCFTCQQTAFVEYAIGCHYQDSKGKMEGIVKKMCELNSTL